MAEIKSNNNNGDAERLLEKKLRVEKILQSPAFLKELNDAVEKEMQSRENAAGSLALQQYISNAVGSDSYMKSSIPKPIIHIDDIGDAIPAGYVKGEKAIRCKLASLYRLVDHFGWTQAIYNHITVRVSKEEEHFLLNPFGMLYHEVTASSLIKLDTQGQIVDGGSTYFGVNIAGFVLHSAIHSARPDAKCVIHVHHPAVVAVSAMKCGLLAVNQEYCLVADGLSYHDFQGILVDESERATIVQDLGKNKQMFLRNHGLVVLGESIEEAFVRIYHIILACESQVRMMSAGLDNLNIISQEALRRTMEMVLKAQEFAKQGMLQEKKGNTGGDKPAIMWKPGEIDFEAYMRLLDSAGYRTGHEYRIPNLKMSDAKY